MQAHQLAQPYPTVRLETPALEAARVLTEHDRPALVVVDDHEHPLAILPGSQVLRMLIPRYVQEDPTLARVVDEGFADTMCAALAEKSVRDLLPTDKIPLSVVAADDTVLEIAAIMAANRSPLVAVIEEDKRTARMIGAINASALLGRILPDG